MTSYTNLLFREEARSKLLAGATALADAVRPTLGPESRSVLLDKKFGNPVVCDDGVTIARQLTLRDADENLGARMLRDAAIQTGDSVGDGTTTATILAHGLFSEGLRNVAAGASAVALRRGLDRGLEAAVSAINALSRPVKDKADTAHVATVSAHNDSTIGEIVAEAVERVGSDGVVEVEQARGTETTLDVVEGLQFDNGYLSPYFITDPIKMEASIDDPLILLYENKITSMATLLPLLEAIVEQGRQLIVIAEAVEGEGLAAMVVNKLRGTLTSVAVKAPGFGERRKATLADIGVLTGARVISEDVGDKLENVSLSDLGSAHRVVVDKDSTTIIDGAGAPELVEVRREELRREIEDTKSDWDREKLEERLARLSGGVAIIRVGAPSEAELARRKESYDDAINSTKAAVEEGIVPGGGVALLRAVDEVERMADTLEGDERTGVLILRSALEAPCRQIARNSSVDDGVVVEKIREASGFFGFDARTRSYKDLDEAGIIDPTKVVRAALENAVSVAGVLLLTEATMTEVEDNEPDMSQMPQMPMM